MFPGELGHTDSMVITRVNPWKGTIDTCYELSHALVIAVVYGSMGGGGMLVPYSPGNSLHVVCQTYAYVLERDYMGWTPLNRLRMLTTEGTDA